MKTNKYCDYINIYEIRFFKKKLLSQFVNPMARSTLTDAIRAQNKCSEKC